MKLIERESLLADKASVTSILDSIPADDELGRLSFEARLAEIDAQLEQLDKHEEHIGRVALIFNGGPVTGSRSVDAIFASNMLKNFQDLVSKQLVVEEVGELGSRGPLPFRARTNLAVSNLIRGSVGFELEEAVENEELADTAIKKALDDVTAIIEKTAARDEEPFEEAIPELDARLLVSLREFFKTLDDNGAQVRIVEGERDADLDTIAIRRGRARVESTNIDDREDDAMIGELLGILPDQKRFEMRLEGGEMIRGTVAAQVADRYLELIEGPESGIVGRWWRVKMKIREVRERNKPPRRLYSLIGLIRPVRARS